jgi:uncharacterized membrane protein YkvA (DUF1232 family)
MALMNGGPDKYIVSSPCPPGTKSSGVRRLPAVVTNWRQQAERVQKEAHVFYFVFRHPGTPWYARLVAACTAGYLLSPIQLIPSFIPGIGFMDDLAVLFLGVKLLQRITPLEVLTECREREIRMKEEISSAAAVIVFVAIAALWLAAGVTASALLAAHLSRR